MFSGTGRVKLLFAIYTSLVYLGNSCRAQVAVEHNTSQACTSSCGNIHNVTYPFGFITDPEHCSMPGYQLSCENSVVTLYLKNDKGQVCGFRVQAINYNNFTIRLLDPNVQLNNCALPVANRLVHDGLSYYWSDTYDDWSLTSTQSYICRNLVFISCPYPTTESVSEAYSPPCNLTRHWYLKVYERFGHIRDNVYVDSIENSCRIEAKAMTTLLPLKAKNISYLDVQNSFAYGFELSWLSICCSANISRKYNCSNLCSNDLNKIRDHMTGYFGDIFYFLDKIKVPSFFPDFNALGFYDDYGDLTTCGLIICFLVAILVVLVLHRLLLFFLGSICVTIFLIYKWRRRHLSAYDNVEEFLQSHQNYLMPVRYSYTEIKKFTKNFKEKLGEGGYGSVYKAKLRSGRFAAIKMLDKSKADGQDFINEVATIGRIHHVNVVKLIGFCVEGSKRALVYEYMDNGSLDKHIFFKEGNLPMNNKMIFDISLGVAHGIEYLHRGCDIQILHFDIKPHNILLDENCIPKISDFGLAKLHSTDHSIVSLTAVRGTMGYIAPEFFYKNIGGISYKADVYSFGMLLMEMVGKRKNVNASTDHSSRIYFPSWIYDQFNEEKEVMLGGDTEEESNMLKKMVIVALWCIQLNPTNRPCMHEVIKMLEGEVEHLKMPPKPFVAPQETPMNNAGLNINSKISSSDA